MEAVRHDADRAGGIAEQQLGAGDPEIEQQDADQDARDGLVPWLRRRRQNTRACPIGHQRSWTLPMMYFFGTKPQCRLSELLLR